MIRKGLAGLAVVACAATLPAVAGAKTKTWTSFKSPSGSIHCSSFKYKSKTSIRCDEYQAENSPPRKPKSCEFDYGFSFGVSTTGKGHRLCVSDATPQTRHVLRYGQTWKRGGITCKSRTSGLTCKNHKHHGFFVSRASQRVF